MSVLKYKDPVTGEWKKIGVNGQDGKSAYAYARDGGYAGTEAEFAEKLAEESPKAFYVNILSMDEGTVDKTDAEIEAAVQAGKSVYLKFPLSENDPVYIINVPLTGILSADAISGWLFEGTFFPAAIGVPSPAHIMTIVSAGMLMGSETVYLADYNNIPPTPNPSSLEINGTRYDGSIFVDYTDTINSMITDVTNKLSATDVGLDEVNNTSDTDKPVSTAQAAAILDAKTKDVSGNALQRVYCSMIPYGNNITTEGTDLNTTNFLKVGNYYCSKNAVAKTLVNCPTTSGFMMQVYSPLSTTIDNETNTWVYRLRKLQVYTGEEYIQYCYSGATAGSWTYGAWNRTIRSNNTATTSANGLMLASDKVKLNGIEAEANKTVVDSALSSSSANPVQNSVVTAALDGKAASSHTHNYYGVCSTDAGTAEKTVSIDGFELVEGAFVVVKFTNANSIASPTLNVSGTGAKPIYRYGTTAVSTGTTTTGWIAGAVQTFTYDGAGWIRDYWNNSTYSNASLGQGYGTCSTAAATVAKTVSLSSYSLTTGGVVAVKFTNSVPANATLNVNSKGAKAIYYKGAKITAGIIDAGDLATFIYNGSYYHLISIDKAKLPNPNALTINGKVYDGSEAVNIEISGGSTSEVNALGQTPITLTEAANIKLVADGECSYTAKGATVADLSTAEITRSNATLTEYEDYIEVVSTGGSTWYNSYVLFSIKGLTVGTTYVFLEGGLGLDTVNLINNGYFVIRDSSGTQLAATDHVGSGFKSYEFTTTTSGISIYWYPASNYYWNQNHRTARVSDWYINEASDGTTRTVIFSKTGTFTDSYLLGEVPTGVTISSNPSCEVYGTSTIGDETTSGATSPLTGKTVVCFGDSLFGMYRGDTSAPAYVAKRTGATVHNIGFGGCRMSVHPTTGYAAFSMWALAKAISEKSWTTQDAQASSGSSYFSEHLATLKGIDFNSVDAIVIHYGTNDFTGNVTIDNASNLLDYNTLCGALRYSIEKLLTTYPNLRIYVSLPAFRYWTSDSGTVTYSTTYTNSGGKTLVNFVDSLISVAKEYNLPVVDCYYGLGINKINASTFLADGVHHNLEGRKRFGGYIGSRLIAEW